MAFSVRIDNILDLVDGQIGVVISFGETPLPLSAGNEVRNFVSRQALMDFIAVQRTRLEDSDLLLGIALDEWARRSPGLSYPLAVGRYAISAFAGSIGTVSSG